MYRSMPKTLDYLLHELGGVEFPHLNKVALNTRPNALAMLLSM